MIQARAAVLHRTGLDGIDIDVVSLDDPHDREVLVRVVASGLCHSDLHVIDGTLPSSGARVLGHEISGIVEQVGDLVSTVAPGARTGWAARPGMRRSPRTPSPGMRPPGRRAPPC
jgi:Zn-dependent alcohol dehydrogenase